MNNISISKQEWDSRLLELLSSYDMYAPVENDFSCDYTKLDADNVSLVVYNKPKPVTPLKKFFLPVKENVTADGSPEKPVAIIGTPNCDVMAQAFLDQIYLDQEFPDPAYRQRRENAIIICADCLSILEHCHCSSYGIEPYGNGHSDISLAIVEQQVILTIHGKKGEQFIHALGIEDPRIPDDPLHRSLEEKRNEVLGNLSAQNRELPDYDKTGRLVSSNGTALFKKYASTCVSCGACSAICPTCSCFLLIDRPGFEKVRQLDTCQYPGFERVAGGEDALHQLTERFRNRYMCKYVWKPLKYSLKACTGCGRCIETCIGQINKNELFLELSK